MKRTVLLMCLCCGADGQTTQPITIYATGFNALRQGSAYAFSPTPPDSALFPLWAPGNVIVGYYVSVQSVQ